MKIKKIRIGSLRLHSQLTARGNFQLIFSCIWLIYSIGFAFCSACESCYTYNLGSYFKYIRVGVCFLLFLLALTMAKATKKRLILSVVIIALSCLIVLSNSSWGFLLMIELILLGQFIDFHKFIKFDIKIKLVLMLCIFLLCFVGLVPNRQGVYGEYGSYKMALGFSHPNVFGIYVYTVLVEWVYLRIKKMHLIEYLAICACVVALDIICRSRTAEFTFIAILAMYGIFRLKPGIIYSKIVHALMVISVPIAAIFSWVITWLYGQGNAFAVQLNSFLSGRLSQWYPFFEVYDNTLFGQQIASSSRGNRQVGILDSTYIGIGLRYGIIFLIAFCLIYMYVIHVLLREKKAELALFCLFMVWVGFGESYTYNSFYNVTLIALVRYSDYKNLLPNFRKRRRHHIRIA